jgi:hypothetical protein
MSKQNWRDEVDLIIEKNLNELIKETKEYDYALSKAKDKSKAQIWLALALLNHKINQLKIEDKKYEKKISEEELDKILKTLEKL